MGGYRSPHPAGFPDAEAADNATQPLFRLYIPKTRLYADQQREMLRIFQDWLRDVLGLQVKRADRSTESGEAVEFFLPDGQPQRSFQDNQREFAAFVENCARDVKAAADALIDTGLPEIKSVHLANAYAKRVHRLELDARHARQQRVLSLQQAFEEELLDAGVRPERIATLQIRSVLEQIVPQPSPSSALPASGREVIPAIRPHVQVTINGGQYISTGQYINAITTTAVNSVQGTLNFGKEAVRIKDLTDQHADKDAVGPLHTALHEIEDPKLPPKTRSVATQQLANFLKDLARHVPDLGFNLLEKYLESKLGLPGS